MKLRRYVYLASGFLMVGLGVAGAVLPLVPTTPFLLLAAYCFARSSPRRYHWLIGHRVFGPYIRAFREKRGLTASQKGRVAVVVTVTLLISFLLAPRWYARVIVACIWFAGMVVLYFSRTAPEEVPETAPNDTPPAS